MDHRVTRCGKQLILDGEHLADARDETAAEIIQIALNHIGVAEEKIPAGEVSKLERFFA